jgi:hypothetical protein
MREFALEAPAASPEVTEVAQRHREWYRHLAASLAPQLTGEAQHEALATLAASAIHLCHLLLAVPWSRDPFRGERRVERVHVVA